MCCVPLVICRLLMRKVVLVARDRVRPARVRDSAVQVWLSSCLAAWVDVSSLLYSIEVLGTKPAISFESSNWSAMGMKVGERGGESASSGDFKSNSSTVGILSHSMTSIFFTSLFFCLYFKYAAVHPSPFNSLDDPF